MIYHFVVVDTYWKDIEVNSKSEEQAKQLAESQAKKLNLLKVTQSDNTVHHERDVVLTKDTYWESLQQIAEETDASWYQNLHAFQKQDLTKEELLEYAEEMSEALVRIYNIASPFL